MTVRPTRLKFLVRAPVIAGLNLPASDGAADWPRYIRTTDISGPNTLTDSGARIDPSQINVCDVLEHDLLVCRTGSLGTIYSHRSREPAAFAGYLVRVRPDRSRLEPRYLNYWARSALCQEQIAAGAIRATVDNFNATKVGNLRIPLRPLPVQEATADFLDRECARIDELQAVLVVQLAKLNDVREATVHGAISDLRSSRLKYGFQVVDCKHRTPAYVASGFSVASTREVKAGALDLRGVDRFVDETDFHDMRSGGRDPRRGDIIYSRNASVGVAAYLDREVEVCMGQDVVLITRRPRDCALLAHVLNYAIKDQVGRRSLGSTFSRINVPVIRSLLVPNDSPDAEGAALAEISAECGRADVLQAEYLDLQAALREYREALITEAVTGKLDPTHRDDTEMAESLAAIRAGETPTVLSR